MTKFRIIVMIMVLTIGSSLMADRADSEKLINAAKQEAGEITPRELKRMIDREQQRDCLGRTRRESACRG